MFYHDDNDVDDDDDSDEVKSVEWSACAASFSKHSFPVAFQPDNWLAHIIIIIANIIIGIVIIIIVIVTIIVFAGMPSSVTGATADVIALQSQVFKSKIFDDDWLRKGSKKIDFF